MRLSASETAFDTTQMVSTVAEPTGAVDETRRLRARTAEIESEPVATLAEMQVKPVEHVVVAVVLEKVDGVEFAVRQLAQARPGRVDHPVHDLGQRARAIAFDQLAEPLARDVDGGDEGTEVDAEL